MPKIKTKRKKTPKGFEVVEETLQAFEQKMREGKIKVPLLLWL